MSTYFISKIRKGITQNLCPPAIQNPPISIFYKKHQHLFHTHYLTNKILQIVQNVADKSFYITPFKKLPKFFLSLNEKAPSLYSVIKKEIRGRLIDFDKNKVSLPNDPAPPTPIQAYRFISAWV